MRRIRKARGFTLAALSELSGVEVGTLSAIEMRDSRRSEYAVPIAQALGVTVEDLYAADNVVPGSPTVQRKLTPEEARVLDLWATLLFDEQRTRVLELLKAEAEAARAALSQLEKRGYRLSRDDTKDAHESPPGAGARPDGAQPPPASKLAPKREAAPANSRMVRARRNPRR